MEDLCYINFILSNLIFIEARCARCNLTPQYTIKIANQIIRQRKTPSQNEYMLAFVQAKKIHSRGVDISVQMKCFIFQIQTLSLTQRQQISQFYHMMPHSLTVSPQKMRSLNEITIQQLLPNIVGKRQSRTQDKTSISLKTKKMLHRFNSADPHSNILEQQSERQQRGPPSIFSVPKGTIFADKRMAPTPSKAARSKVQQIIEIQLLKKKISELQSLQKYSNNQEKAFNDALLELGISDSKEISPDKESNKQYVPYKKRVQQRKLKPIISQTQFKKGGQTELFFNVQKMTINLESKPAKGITVKSEDQQIKFEALSRKKAQSQFENGRKSKNKRKSVVVVEQLSQIHVPEKPRSSLIIKTIEPRTYSPEKEKGELSHRRMSVPLTQKTLETLGYIPFNQIKEVQETPTERQQIAAKRQIKRYKKKFQPPFPTYNYRNLLWKTNYANRIFVEPPVEYDHRLKVYVGKGNNSCMVAGLISRRIWFAVTDKIQEANFVWTQLKQLSFLKKQSNYTGEEVKQHKGDYLSSSIWTDSDENAFKKYFNTYFSSQEHGDERMLSRSKQFKYEKYIKASEIKQQKMQNHLINNYILGNKKALFNTMANYYNDIQENVFSYLPLTFHIKEGLEDPKYFEFLKYYHKRAKQINKQKDQKGPKQYNAWIVKPGQNSNRGNGIKMCLNFEQIKAILKKRQKYQDGSYRTYIVQAYIERPLLYYKRKFDLRHYIMMTCINGKIKGYWYKQGYVRTTSTQYSLKDNSGSIHLTNDAVQKNLPQYGKYQKGNKTSYEELSNYIEKYHKKKGCSFYQDIYPKMKKMAADSMRAASGGIDPAKLTNNFEVFGMDFMIDSNLDVWLIQINTNPCLQLSCPLLGCIIPRMVEDALELTMDAIFPPPQRFSPKGMHFYKQLEKQNKFQLVYDERVQPLYKGALNVLDNKLLEEEDDTFQDCGQQWQDQ